MYSCISSTWAEINHQIHQNHLIYQNYKIHQNHLIYQNYKIHQNHQIHQKHQYHQIRQNQQNLLIFLVHISLEISWYYDLAICFD